MMAIKQQPRLGAHPLARTSWSLGDRPSEDPGGRRSRGLGGDWAQEPVNWVAVKELNLSYHNPETI